MFGRPPTNFGPPGPFPGPGQFPPFHMQPPRTGGFLSRLFGGGARPGIGGIGGAPGSNLFGMMNPGGQGFLGTMQNVEKMIQLAQTVKPMIDQYGPMVKNIPSMLNLLKEYKAYSAEQEEQNDEIEDILNKVDIKESQSNTEDKKNTSSAKPHAGIKVVPRPKPSNNQTKPIQKLQTKKSTPKLYI